MRNDALKQELDSYLSSRRRTAQQSVEAPMSHLETYDDEPKRSWFSRWFGNAEKKEEQPIEQPEQEEFTIKNSLDNEQLKTDLKELARISLDACKSLPPEKLQEFKNSSDFTRFKDILKKHGVIR